MNRQIEQLAAQVATEIAACADMARADGHEKIASMLESGARMLRHTQVDGARSPLRVAWKATVKFDDYKLAHVYASLAVEAFENAFGEL